MIGGASVRYGGITLAVLTLSGCIHLHSEVRQKQGEEAAKAWSEVDLKSTFRVERENLNKLLNAELHAQERLALVVREAELRKMLAPDSAALSQILATRFNALTDAQPQAVPLRLTAWSAANIRMKRNSAEQIDTRRRLAFLGAPQVTCDEAPGAEVSENWQNFSAEKPARASLAQVLLTQLRDLCKVGADLQADLVAALEPFRGRIGTARDEVVEMREQIKTAKALRKRYHTAVAEQQKALKEASSAPNDVDLKKKVTETAGALKGALEALAGAQDAFSKELVSKERIKKYEKALTDIASNTTGKVPEGATDLAIAAVLLPQIFHEAQVISAAGKVPETLPLAIRLGIERLRLEAATREVKSLETQLELSEEIVHMLAKQAHQLELAWRDLQPLKEAAQSNVLAAFAAAENKPASEAGDAKVALYTAAARYLDTVGRLDANYYRLEYMRIAAAHGQTLSRSEVNAAQWETLIDSTVKQAAQHAAGGLKASDLNGLISALGILWIGHGTNK